MTVSSARYALVGWATVKAGKFLGKKAAKRKLPWQKQQKSHVGSTATAFAAGAATLVGGAWLYARLRQGGDEGPAE